MKNEVLNSGFNPLLAEECINLRGGGEIRNTVTCIARTLTTGRGAIRTGILGFGLFGCARLIGVAVGCANL